MFSFMTSKKAQTRTVVQACARALREIDLIAPGNVFQLHNSTGESGWLISIFVPPTMMFSPVDTLSLKTFLNARIADALRVKPGQCKVVLHLNSEARRLPFESTTITAQWLRTRVQMYKDREAAAKQRVLNAQKAVTRPKPEPPAQEPPDGKSQAMQSRLMALMQDMEDDEHFVVPDAASTDF